MKPTGWRNALIALIEGVKDKPFEFGVNDCAVGLAFPAIAIQTGLDLGEPFRGRYSALSECALIVKKLGHSNLAGYVGAHFNEVPVLSAQYGDIASMPSEHEGWSLGVVLRDHIGVVGLNGYEIVPNRLLALRVFRIA